MDICIFTHAATLFVQQTAPKRSIWLLGFCISHLPISPNISTYHFFLSLRWPKIHLHSKLQQSDLYGFGVMPETHRQPPVFKNINMHALHFLISVTFGELLVWISGCKSVVWFSCVFLKGSDSSYYFFLFQFISRFADSPLVSLHSTSVDFYIERTVMHESQRRDHLWEMAVKKKEEKKPMCISDLKTFKRCFGFIFAFVQNSFPVYSSVFILVVLFLCSEPLIYTL